MAASLMAAARSGLTHVPAAIGRLTSLRMLDLGHHAIAALPDAIGDLAALRYLTVRGNRLADWPAWVDAVRSGGCVVYV